MLQNRCTIFLYTIHFLQLFNRFEIILKYKLKSIIKCHFSLDILWESPFHQALQSVYEVPLGLSVEILRFSDTCEELTQFPSSASLPLTNTIVTIFRFSNCGKQPLNNLSSTLNVSKRFLIFFILHKFTYAVL